MESEFLDYLLHSEVAIDFNPCSDILSSPTDPARSTRSRILRRRVAISEVFLELPAPGGGRGAVWVHTMTRSPNTVPICTAAVRATNWRERGRVERVEGSALLTRC